MPPFLCKWQAVADPKYSSHVHFSTFESWRGWCEMPFAGGARVELQCSSCCWFEEHFAPLCQPFPSGLRSGGGWCGSQVTPRAVLCLSQSVTACLSNRSAEQSCSREHLVEERRGSETFRPDVEVEGQIFMVEISSCHIRDGLKRVQKDTALDFCNRSCIFFLRLN